MATAGTAAWRNVPAACQVQSILDSGSQGFSALPQPLLELILFPGTSTSDKKALRQTSKMFKQLLDNSCVCLEVFASSAKHGAVEFIKRMQHWCCLQSVIFTGCFCSNRLLKLLPDKLTTLTFRSFEGDLQELARLPYLTSLNIGFGGTASGLHHISGLTSLHAATPVGSLAHLAPTLKQLRIREFPDVQGLHLLTKLEVLEVRLADFFKIHSNLPLRQLATRADCCQGFSDNSQAWKLAPTTLTRLTLADPLTRISSSLPASITHLQLLNPQCDVIGRAAAAVPGLKRLDIYSAFTNGQAWYMRRFTNLQHLGVCRFDFYNEERPLTLEQLLNSCRGIAEAVENGVHLTIFADKNNMLGMFAELDAFRSAWATHV